MNEGKKWMGGGGGWLRVVGWGGVGGGGGGGWLLRKTIDGVCGALVFYRIPLAKEILVKNIPV